MIVPIQIGVLALGAGTYFVVQSIDRPDRPAPRATITTTTPAPIPATAFVSTKGRFAIDVPNDMTTTGKGKGVRISSSDNTLLLSVGPVGGGSLKAAADDFVAALKQNYTNVKVLGSKDEVVDGRKALSTFGQAVNSGKVRVRFAAVVVAAKPSNFAIDTFTAFDTDPAATLPRVNAIVSSFRVLKR